MDRSFFLAGGIGFLLALLGWSDQILGLQEKSRRQEKELLTSKNAKWGDLRKIIRTTELHNPEEKLKAALKLVATGVIAKEADVELLDLFKEVDDRRASLETLYEIRYWTVVGITTIMLLTGLIWQLTSHPLPCFAISFTWRHLLYGCWAVLLCAVLALTVIIGISESSFRRDLSKVEDMVTELQDESSVDLG